MEILRGLDESLRKVRRLTNVFMAASMGTMTGVFFFRGYDLLRPGINLLQSRETVFYFALATAVALSLLGLATDLKK